MGKSQVVCPGEESPMHRGQQVQRPLCLKNRNEAGLPEEMEAWGDIGRRRGQRCKGLVRLYALGFDSVIWGAAAKFSAVTEPVCWPLCGKQVAGGQGRDSEPNWGPWQESDEIAWRLGPGC